MAHLTVTSPVGSAGITDDSIVNADVNSAAAIAISKLSTAVADKSSASAQAFTGVVRPAAAAAVTDAPRLDQLSSKFTIASGALPNTGAWVSGTAKVNPVARQIVVCVEVVTDGTANAATCTIAVSADDSTYTTVATPGASAAVNTVGGITSLASVILPAGWYLKLTFSHATVAASVYY